MWPKAISMIANGDLPMKKIISHVFPLQDFKKGIEMVSSGINHPHTRFISSNFRFSPAKKMSK